MKTPITYYGGKQRMIKYILPLIPQHTIYVEPFFGGGAVFFAKPKSKLEVINDTNDVLITFYRVCQNESKFKELKELIKGTLHSESEHKKAKNIYKNKDQYSDVLQAWALWCLAQLSFCGEIGAGFRHSKKRNESKIIMYKRNYFDEKYLERLEQVEIFCRDALDVIKIKDSVETFFYIDPPYINTYMGHYDGYTEQDFKNLLDLLSKVQGKFMLSSYQSEILKEYTAVNGWNNTMVKVLCHSEKLSKEKSQKRSERIEVLTFNYQPIMKLN